MTRKFQYTFVGFKIQEPMIKDWRHTCSISGQSPTDNTETETLVALGSCNTWNELVNRLYSEFPDDKQLDFAAEQIS